MNDTPNQNTFPLTANHLEVYKTFLDDRLGEERDPLRPSSDASSTSQQMQFPLLQMGLPRTPNEPITPWLTQSLEHEGFPLLMAEFLAHQAAGVYNDGEFLKAGYFQKLQHQAETCHERRFASKNADAYGFVFEEHAVVVFRGTDGLDAPDWLHNLSAKHTSFVFKRDSFLEGTPQVLDDVHKGFCEHLNLIKWEIDAWIDSLPDHVDKIICAGHSLGGALAVLMAQLLTLRDKTVVMVQTFGAPAVGGESFAQSYSLTDKTWTVINGSDPIPTCTSNEIGFVHVGMPINVVSNEVSTPFDETYSRGLFEAAYLFLVSTGTMMGAIAGSVAKILGPKAARFKHGLPAHSMVNSYVASIEDWVKGSTREVDPQIIRQHRRYCGLPIGVLEMINKNKPESMK